MDNRTEHKSQVTVSQPGRSGSPPRAKPVKEAFERSGMRISQDGRYIPMSPHDERARANRKHIEWDRKIFVCSPYRPSSDDPAVAERQLEENITRAKLACQFVTAVGFMPLCPHLYFTSFLDDRDCLERETGLLFGQNWVLESEELWVFGDVVTEGMRGEIELADSWDVPVRFMPEPAIIVNRLLEGVRGTGYEQKWMHNVHDGQGLLSKANGAEESKQS